MPLIPCPECGHQVSSMAPTCPQCGAPIVGAGESKAAGALLTTTQETSKRLKLHIVISLLIFWPALIWLFSAISVGESGEWQVGLVIVSLVWCVVTKIRIWWHHK